ncbi:hypothetical protein [Methanobrevibacter sp. A27]|nr:hypothetical protein [Methanobrevibacter sp. A27]
MKQKVIFYIIGCRRKLVLVMKAFLYFTIEVLNISIKKIKCRQD